MKSFLFCCFLAASSFVEGEPLVVGTSSGYAPFVSINEKGEYEGFDIDFANALSKKMGRELEIKDFGSMPSLLLSLKQKKSDVLIWAISITDERLEKMDMVYYQGEKVQEMPFLFWNTVPEGIEKIEDFSKEKLPISVEAGSFQEGVIKKYPNLKSKQVEKYTDGVMEIRYGKAIAAMVDPSLVKELKKKFPELQVRMLPLKVEDVSYGNGICLRKGDPLLKQVQKAVDELTAEGTISGLEKKWNL